MDNEGRIEFMNIMTDNFVGLESENEIEFRAKEMIKLIEQYKEQAKGYLKAGIL